MDRLVTLRRVDSGDQGVFGTLTAEGFRCFTGELPWRDNASLKSCVPSASYIPPGRYRVIWTPSPRLRKNTYRLLGVPNRSGILIHSSNLMGDRSLGYKAQLLGCISLGERIGFIAGQKALLISRPAVRRFEEVMQHKPFTLEVTDA